MKRSLLLKLLLLLSFTAVLFPSRQAAAQPGQLSALEIIAQVNAFRASQDLPPYQENPILMKVAQTHADHIASSGVVTRFDAGGFSPYQRAMTAGYAVAGDLSIGGLFFELLYSGAGASVVEVVNAWKEDTESLNAMASPDFKDIGVGLAIANGITYYVLDVGASTSENRLPAAQGTGTQSAPVITSTALVDGDVYHIVQADQALWSIALAYNTTIEQLKLLNSLSTDEIFIGQKLLVQKPETPTPTPSQVITATFGIPTSTPTKPPIPTATFTPTPPPVPPASFQSAQLVVGAIILAALFAAALGAWLGRKRPAKDFTE